MYTLHINTYIHSCIHIYTCVHIYIGGKSSSRRQHTPCIQCILIYIYTYIYIRTYMYKRRTYMYKRQNFHADFTKSINSTTAHSMCNILCSQHAKEPYKKDDILQKRPVFLRSLLIVATPQNSDFDIHQFDNSAFHVQYPMFTTMYTRAHMYKYRGVALGLANIYLIKSVFRVYTIYS